METDWPWDPQKQTVAGEKEETGSDSGKRRRPRSTSGGGGKTKVIGFYERVF